MNRYLPLLAACLGFAAAGCGFTPMYADAGINQSLAGVAVETPSHSRTGYLMRQALDDELGRSRGEAPRYRVRLDLSETRAPRGVRVNNVAARYEITLVTSYTLLDAETDTPVTGGGFATQVSYDSADGPYAGLAASQEGEERVAQQAALRLRLELSRYLKGHPYHAAATAAGAQQRYVSKVGSRSLSTNPDNLDAERDDLALEPSTEPGRSPNAPPADPPTTTRATPSTTPQTPRDPL